MDTPQDGVEGRRDAVLRGRAEGLHCPWTVPAGRGCRRNPGRRGSAYLLAITVTLTAAVVAGVLATAATSRLSVVAARADRADAIALASAELARIEQALAVDPDLLLDQVWDTERARVCVADLATYQPGEVWPAGCGTRWTYTQADDPAAVRVQVVPPSPADPALRVEVLARACAAADTELGDCHGTVDSGMARRYVRQGPGWATVHSDLPVSAADLAKGPSGSVLVTGATVYAAGDITLPAGADTAVFAEATWVTETTTAGPVPAGSRAATPVTSPDVRSFATSPQLTGGMQAALADTVAVGCPADPTAIPAVEDGLAAWLCLDPGRPLVRTGGEVVTVPASAVAFRLSTGAGGQSLRVDYATTVPTVPACPSAPCNPHTQTVAALGAGTHPADPATWTQLANDLALPGSGVVAATAEVHLGLSPTVDAGPDPDDVVAADPFQPANPVTVVAGTAAAPADIVAGTSVDAATAPSGDPVPVTLAAFGEVRIAPWAADAADQVLVEAALVALGLDGPADRPGWASPVRTDPATAPGYVPADGYGDLALRIVGSVVAPSVSLDLDVFATTQVHPNPTAAGTPSPYAPTFDPAWQPIGTTLRSGSAVCGQPRCDLY